MDYYLGPQKLYIIGNGFDCHHGLFCSYKNFRQWLEDNYPDVNDNLNRIYGKCDGIWWRTFEESLTDFDPDKYPKEVAQTSFFELQKRLEQRYGQEGRDVIDNYEVYENGSVSDRYRLAAVVANFEMSKLKDDLTEVFGEWVRTLGVPPKETKIENIDTDALFFTFNYTRTLEELYGIDENSVFHLHGSVDNGVFIIGHNMTMEEMLERDLKAHAHERDPDKDKGEDEARYELFQVIADHLRKPVDDIIDENSNEFNALTTIKEVIVLGFSYSPIDLPYLREVFAITGPEIVVKLGWHSNDDMKNAEAFKNEMKLTNCMLFEF